MSPAPRSPRTILACDAATCLAMGALLALESGRTALMTGLPPEVLRAAGLLLLPVGAVIATVAGWPRLWNIRLVVFGNALWVVASLGLLALTRPNAIGVAFVLAQAAVVAGFAWLERAGGRTALPLMA